MFQILTNVWKASTRAILVQHAEIQMAVSAVNALSNPAS